MNESTTRKICKFFDLPIVNNKVESSVSYAKGKCHQQSFSFVDHSFTKFLELVFSDVWGPSPYISP